MDKLTNDEAFRQGYKLGLFNLSEQLLITLRFGDEHSTRKIVSLETMEGIIMAYSASLSVSSLEDKVPDLGKSYAEFNAKSREQALKAVKQNGGDND